VFAANELGQFKVQTSTGWGTVQSDGLLLTDTSWHLYVGRYDGANLSIYVDGQFNTSEPFSGSIVTNTPGLSIGSTWVGKIDDVRIYNRALSASEIEQLYQSISGVSTSISNTESDVNAPTRSSGSPTGVLSVGTTNATLSLVTNESAVCKYATQSGLSYGSMNNNFNSTGGTVHNSSLSNLSNGSTYSYYIRCQDSEGNQNTTDYKISFSVEAPKVNETPNTVSVLYVDGQIASNCINNYSIQGRDCTGTDGSAFTTIQQAADLVQPGSTVYIRGGTYQNNENNCRGSGFCELVWVTRSGTANNRIAFSNYQNEKPVLRGYGFEDRDLDGDGKADGVIFGGGRETLFVVEGDYNTVRGLEFKDSGKTSISIRGSHNIVENNYIHDGWDVGITIGLFAVEAKIVEGNTVRLNEIRNIRHGNGILIGRSTPSGLDTYLNFTRNNIIESNLSYKNGYLPNGIKVLPALGDVTGGGNSDGMGSFKVCSDSATETVDNWCPNNTIRNNIVFGNADDGFDMSMTNMKVEGNISFGNGPEGNKGYKILRYVPGVFYRGNVAYQNNSFGFELRLLDGSEHSVENNTGIGNFTTLLTNNNRDGLDTYSSSNIDTSDAIGKVVKVNPVIDTNFSASWSVQKRLDHVRNQFKASFTPVAGSPLIDAGKLIEGYHCGQSGPAPTGATCKEWYGSAPDLGAYEYVPDKGEIVSPTTTDTTPPTLSNLSVTNITTNTATIK